MEICSILDEMDIKDQIDNLPSVPGFNTPNEIRDKFRNELGPEAYVVYAKALMNGDEEVSLKAAKEVLEFAGVSPKTSSPTAGLNLQFPAKALENVMSGINQMFNTKEAQDVEVEIMDYEENTGQAEQPVHGGDKKSKDKVEPEYAKTRDKSEPVEVDPDMWDYDGD